MNERERFHRLMTYQPVDRLPVLALEPYEETALARWRQEGLPAGAEVVDFLGMARLVHVPISLGPSPAFTCRVLADDGEYLVQTTALGATIRCRKDNPSMFYGHIDHPIKTRADWEAYKERLPVPAGDQLPAGWDQDLVARLAASENPVGICPFPFFFRFGFYTMGMARFLTAFHDEPEMMHDMFAHYGAYVAATIRPVLDRLPLDYAVFCDDLAGKNGPLVSPRTYEEFWYPYQDPILGLLKSRGVPVICEWSSGYFAQLLPGMLAHGFNCLWPMEVMAGMDAVRLRRRHGRELRFGGNIAKEAVIAGPQAIDDAIDRLMPLIREGGFLPGLDDMASPDMPFPHYRHLIARLQETRLGG